MCTRHTVLVDIRFIWLLLLTTFSAGSYDFVIRPEFGEELTELTVNAFVGQTSHLPCTVKHLAGKQVSWIRGHDLQVLSTGRSTFSTDLRISVLPGAASKARSPRDIVYQACVQCTGTGPFSISPLHYVKVTEGVYKTSQSNRKDEGKPQPRHTLQGWTRARHRPKGRRGRHTRRNKKMPRVRRAQEFKFVSDIMIDLYREAESHLPSHFFRKSIVQSNSQRSLFYRPLKNSISIYPQGPFLGGEDDKLLQPGPNDIGGIWEPEDYTLQIKYTRLDDAGTYMCQINTEPRIFQTVLLKVFKVKAEIIGSHELFVKAGNPVALPCRVSHGSMIPGFTLWYKEERLVEYESSGGRIRVLTLPEGMSHLEIEDARTADSGNYTCSPSGGVPASLVLNVIEDERQAAMQQGNVAAGPGLADASLLIPFLLVTVHFDPSFPALSLWIHFPLTGGTRLMHTARLTVSAIIATVVEFCARSMEVYRRLCALGLAFIEVVSGILLIMSGCAMPFKIFTIFVCSLVTLLGISLFLPKSIDCLI